MYAKFHFITNIFLLSKINIYRITIVYTEIINQILLMNNPEKMAQKVWKFNVFFLLNYKYFQYIYMYYKMFTILYYIGFRCFRK